MSAELTQSSSPIKYTREELESFALIADKVEAARVSAIIKAEIAAAVTENSNTTASGDTTVTETIADDRDAKITELETENEWLRNELKRSETELLEVTTEIVNLHQKNEELKHENNVKQGLINTLVGQAQVQVQNVPQQNANMQYQNAPQQNAFAQNNVPFT